MKRRAGAGAGNGWFDHGPATLTTPKSLPDFQPLVAAWHRKEVFRGPHRLFG